MATSQVSRDVSAYIRKWLNESGTPQFEAAKWAGIPPANLSLRLSGGADWKISELANFSEQVFGMPLIELLIQSETCRRE
jgi:hypothetical protein